MSDISKIKLPNGDIYNLKDSNALHNNDTYVQDVQINNTSIISNGIANFPLATTSNLGVIKAAGSKGINVNDDGTLRIQAATEQFIQEGTHASQPIVPLRQHTSVFYGLTKAAGIDMNNSNNTVGTYTDEAKGAIQHMIGTDAAIAPYEADVTADRSYAIGDTFMMDGKLYKATAAIAQNGVITPDSNCVETNVDENYVKDVQINSTSITNNGVANIPLASTTTVGAVKLGDTMSITGSGAINFRAVGASEVKAGTSYQRALSPERQHASVFYGLTKAAGVDMKNSSNAIGVYTDEAKGAIQHMLGTDTIIAPYEADITADRSYAINDTFMMNGKLYKATAAIAQGGVITPDSNCIEVCIDQVYVKDVQINDSSIISNGIANIPRATGADYGVAKMATDAVVKAGTDYYSFLTPMRNHISTFYGLAKAAGDTTQVNSSNAVGTYTTEAKTAIQTMLNVPDTASVITDVQIKGTSIKNNGIADIPQMSESVAGVVKRGSGLYINSSGQLCSNIGTATTIKQGTAPAAIAPISLQGNTVFYGLAKAAGVDMSSSSNTVGTYTDAAKASIKSMLGIVDGSTGTVNVSGTTPTITAVENTRYVCGEVSTLSITPPSSGICIIRFTSGTTATVLTVPNTVIWPEWFDATTLESSRVYEICITDGVYGAVMSWPL